MGLRSVFFCLIVLAQCACSGGGSGANSGAIAASNGGGAAGCSGTYEVNASGTIYDMTIYSNDSGQFIGTAATGGGASEDVSGTCGNGNMTFTINGKSFTGTYQ